jgi:hypothetical protein
MNTANTTYIGSIRLITDSDVQLVLSYMKAGMILQHVKHLLDRSSTPNEDYFIESYINALKAFNDVETKVIEVEMRQRSIPSSDLSKYRSVLISASMWKCE